MFRRACTWLMVCGVIGAAASYAFADNRVSASNKGSLLVFSKVEVKWDATGKVVQDTFLDLVNDYPADVTVQLYYVNGDGPLPEVTVGSPPVLVERAHPGWNWVDCQMVLTKDQPTYWSVLTGLNSRGSLCQPFTVLDPGTPPGRPDLDGDPGARVLRGFVYAWAVDAAGEEIRWNHLAGGATLVNYAETSAWEYNAYAFQAVGTEHGLPTDATPGQLLLDGYEYDLAFDKLLLNFYASGSQAFSAGTNGVQVDTDLTVFAVSADLRQDGGGPITTKVKFDVWNMNEVRFSGTERCITCWDQTLLSKYVTVANHFQRGNLQTDMGKARLDGLQSTVCPGVSADAALLGVAAKKLVFSGAATGVAWSGSTLVGQGEQDGSVMWDIIAPPEELWDNAVTPDDTVRKPVRVGASRQ